MLEPGYCCVISSSVGEPLTPLRPGTLALQPAEDRLGPLRDRLHLPAPSDHREGTTSEVRTLTLGGGVGGESADGLSDLPEGHGRVHLLHLIGGGHEARRPRVAARSNPASSCLGQVNHRPGLAGDVRKKSGKVKGRTSMNLAFDSIRLSDGRSGTLHGYVTHVYGSDSGTADNEGGIESGSRTKQTVKRGAIGAGAGAVLGAIVGGGKGAGIGLLLGGAGGAGSLAVKGSKELKIESGTEMIVRVTR